MKKSSVASTAADTPEALEVVQEPTQARTESKSRVELIRDRFKMPRRDFELLASLKERSLGLDRPVKKNELLRAGLSALQRISDAELCQVLDSLVPLEARSPKKKNSGFHGGHSVLDARTQRADHQKAKSP